MPHLPVGNEIRVRTAFIQVANWQQQHLLGLREQWLQGGLGLPLDEFTVALTIGALVLIAYSIWFYPRTVKRFGSLTLVKASSRTRARLQDRLRTVSAVMPADHKIL